MARVIVLKRILVSTHGDAAAKAAAFAGLRKVCRTGTHLFHFAQYANALRGWGRGLRRAVGRWYADPDDRGMLDVVRFDTTVPAVLADFVRS